MIGYGVTIGVASIILILIFRDLVGGFLATDVRIGMIITDVFNALAGRQPVL
jgi:hypothetical protein